MSSRKITQATPAALNNVYMIGPSDGGANLWIEDLNIKNSSDKNFIQFQGADNTLNFKGTNTFDSSIRMSKSVINVGNGLTVEGGKDGKGIFDIKIPSLEGAFIGAGNGEDLSNSAITVNSGNFLSSSKYRDGCIVGTGFSKNMFSAADIGNVSKELSLLPKIR